MVAHPKYFSIISEGVGFVEAASLPRAVLTAWQAVRVQKGGLLRKGMRVLVTGATGAVGRMAIQVLRGVVGEGGRVIAVGGVGSEGLKGLGADVVVNYREVSDWEDVVRREGKVDVVLDIVGGKTLERCLSLVKDGGQVIALGSPEPVWENVKGWKEAQQRGVKGLFFIVEGNGEQLKEITALVQEGAIKPSVSVVVDGLTEGGVRDGWTKAERGGLAGSVVVKVV